MTGFAKKLSVMAFIVTLGVVGLAFAHGGFDGYGFGGHMMGPGYGMMGPGYGPHMMGPDTMGYGHPRGWRGDSDNLELSRQQADKLESAQESFYRDTRDLRSQIYDKNAQIQEELAKQNPDRGKIMDLQKSVSKLESELDQKQIDFQLEARKIAPELGEGFVGRGYGPGAGYCWR
ncbi:MAG: periplasmic heavy metal sensor [Desulfobacterales bacterium]|nr:periplasmic heavy metal sensor [Desulfobacterales bacterium]MCF8080998.1 periplasmic heavy metal sensor [Desulfobacterales bacterium]